MADDQVITPAIDSTDFAAFKEAAAAVTKDPAVDDKTKVIDDKVVDKVKVIEDAVVDHENATPEEKAVAAADAEAKALAEVKAKNKGKTVSQRIAEFRRQTTAAQEQAEIEAGENERNRLRAEKAEAELAAERAGKKKDGVKTTGFNNEPLLRPDGRPNFAAYEFGVLDPAYDDAKEEYREAQTAKALTDQGKKSADESKAEAEKRETLTKFEGVVAKGLDKYDDYLQVVVQGADEGKWLLTPVSAQALIDMDFGHEVSYHLAKNPAEAAEIAGLPPHRQLLALGRLEARFATEAVTGASEEDDDNSDEGAHIPPKTTAKLSSAPIPPKKAPRGNDGQINAAPDTKDFGAYKRLVQKAQAARN